MKEKQTHMSSLDSVIQPPQEYARADECAPDTDILNSIAVINPSLRDTARATVVHNALASAVGKFAEYLPPQSTGESIF